MRDGVWRLGLRVLAIGLILAGCTPAAGDAPAAVGEEEALPAVTQVEDGRILAEGVVEPVRVVTLVAPVGGAVTDVPVDEGTSVVAGTTLAQIDATDVSLMVREAEAAVAVAEAQLALAEAGTRDEQVAVVAAQIDAADAVVAQAAAERDVATAGLAAADLLDAQAELLEAELAHTQADEAHDDTMVCYDVPTADGGEREICPALGTLEEMARAQLEAAYAGILASRAQLEVVEARAEPEIAVAQAGVQAAIADRDAAQAQLDLAKSGARREEIAVAAAGVEQARAAVAQARDVLDQYSVEASLDGTVTDVVVKPGDVAVQGMPLATVATLDRLQIRTTDLTELDIAQVVVGQPVVVTLDAAPEVFLRGSVQRLASQGTAQYGDVIYDVIVDLDATPEWVRWGMTAQVEILTAESVDDLAVVPGARDVPERSVIVEGAVAPDRSTGLTFLTGGQVAEVLVAAGDIVEAGDVIARLDDSAQQLAVTTAAAARSTAQAELALAEAGPRSEDVAAGEATLAAAEAGLWQAVAARDQLQGGVAEAEKAGVEAQMQQSRAQRRQLEAALHWAEDDDDEARAEDIRDQMRAVDLTIAGLEARLTALPIASEARLRGANAAVSAAQAQVNVAQANLDLVSAGPTSEAIALAQSKVRQAEVAVARAEVALSRTQLSAPFAGTITQVDIEVGDTVAPGQPLAVLADLTRLRVDTTDLLELDVVAVTEGQPAQISVDALPGQTWSGHVRRIKPQSALVRGDVTYPTIIDLDEPVPGLRWGMTVAVTIE